MAAQFYVQTLPAVTQDAVRRTDVQVEPVRNVISRPSPTVIARPQERSTHSSAPAMRLPSGYTTDHWAWSMSDPSFRPSDSTTVPWDELDNMFLFPMASLKDASILTDEVDDFDWLSSADSASVSSASTSISDNVDLSSVIKKKLMTEQPESGRHSQPLPPARAQSYVGHKSQKHQASVARSNSVTVSMIKSARRSRRQQQDSRAREAHHHRSAAETAALKLQIAVLTQKLTMAMANRCAACRMGLIDCGLSNSLDSSAQEKVQAHDQMEDDAGSEKSEAEDVLQKLTRKAEMLSFG
jgi:hypothetical protein